MSIGPIIVLSAVIGALVVFAVVLAWGDYRAQQLARRIRERHNASLIRTKLAANMSERRFPPP